MIYSNSEFKRLQGKILKGGLKVNSYYSRHELIPQKQISKIAGGYRIKEAAKQSDAHIERVYDNYGKLIKLKKWYAKRLQQSYTFVYTYICKPYSRKNNPMIGYKDNKQKLNYTILKQSLIYDLFISQNHKWLTAGCRNFSVIGAIQHWHHRYIYLRHMSTDSEAKRAKIFSQALKKEFPKEYKRYLGH